MRLLRLLRLFGPKRGRKSQKSQITHVWINLAAGGQRPVDRSCLNNGGPVRGRNKRSEHPRRNSTRFQGEAPVGETGCNHRRRRPAGGLSQFEDLEVTVDTGSTFTAVPQKPLLQRLGVPVRRSARSRLADGSSAPRGHRLDSGQAIGGPDLRNTGDIRRGKPTQSAGSGHAGGMPCWQ